MSGERHDLRFSVITEDTQHWNPNRDKQFPNGPDDVVDRLREVMMAAGNWYIRMHPDLFRLDQLL